MPGLDLMLTSKSRLYSIISTLNKVQAHTHKSINEIVSLVIPSARLVTVRSKYW